jgi:hypothetical protein
MTYPKQPRHYARNFLGLIAIYVVGLAPGAALDLLTPSGPHLHPLLPTLIGVAAGVPCGLAVVWLARLVIRRAEYRQLFALMIMIYSLAWTGPALVRFANKALDRSPRVAHTLTVLAVSRPSKGADTNTVTHWDPGADPFTVAGSQDVGSSLNIYSHSGFLGFVWIELPGDDYQNRHRGMLP